MQQYIDILCTVSFYVKTVSMYRYVVNCKLYQYITYRDNVLWLADNQIIGLVVNLNGFSKKISLKNTPDQRQYITATLLKIYL